MRNRANRRPLRYTVALVGDGFTESIYFTDLRDTDRPEGLRIIPDLPGRIGSFQGVISRAIQLAEDYDRVYALIDMDAVIAQHQQPAYQQHKAAAKAAGVIVLENNPCFEIWLLLHFERTGRHFQNCQQVETALRRHIPGYSKNLRYIEAARLYYRLGDRLAQAIANAEALEADREDHDEHYPRSEVLKFFNWYLARHH